MGSEVNERWGRGGTGESRPPGESEEEKQVGGQEEGSTEDENLTAV